MTGRNSYLPQYTAEQAARTLRHIRDRETFRDDRFGDDEDAHGYPSSWDDESPSPECWDAGGLDQDIESYGRCRTDAGRSRFIAANIRGLRSVSPELDAYARNLSRRRQLARDWLAYYQMRVADRRAG